MTAWIGCVVGLVGIASMFQPTMIVGNSMSPTLRSGKMIWIDRAYYRTHRPQRGEVVVFKLGDQVYVKRVYRVGGESYFTLDTARWGFTPIREGREKEMAARFGHRANTLRVREVGIPEGHVFVLGDNYFDSIDSRELGPIPIESILGRAMIPVDLTFGLSHELVPPPIDKEQALRQSKMRFARAH
jgi:signal peptidase I